MGDTVFVFDAGSEVYGEYAAAMPDILPEHGLHVGVAELHPRLSG